MVQHGDTWASKLELSSLFDITTAFGSTGICSIIDYRVS